MKKRILKAIYAPNDCNPFNPNFPPRRKSMKMGPTDMSIAEATPFAEKHAPDGFNLVRVVEVEA